MSKEYLTVAEVISILQTMPQDLPVTGYNAIESTDFVTPKGIRLQQADSYDYLIINGQRYSGQYVDIMGF